VVVSCEQVTINLEKLYQDVQDLKKLKAAHDVKEASRMTHNKVSTSLHRVTMVFLGCRISVSSSVGRLQTKTASPASRSVLRLFYGSRVVPMVTTPIGSCLAGGRFQAEGRKDVEVYMKAKRRCVANMDAYARVNKTVTVTLKHVKVR
jgi:hypothetical protein